MSTKKGEVTEAEMEKKANQSGKVLQTTLQHDFLLSSFEGYQVNNKCAADGSHHSSSALQSIRYCY